MTAASEWHFGPFRVEAANARLWRGTEVVHLRPKSFAVLCYLLTHAGRLVSRDELLQAVWPEVVVSDAMLTICISELRHALEEGRQAPPCIETVPRRGYRFRAPVTLVAPGPAAPSLPAAQSAAGAGTAAGPGTERRTERRPASGPVAVELVGREAELAQLGAWVAQARQGARQVVWVCGESGIGKTALVDALLARVAAEGSCGVVHGQCVAHYGPGEAYLPVLDALEQGCQGPQGEPLVRLLRHYAPTWLAQMPAVAPAAEREVLQGVLQGATPAHMLREFAGLVEAWSAEHPVVLVLEDLHWSDYATVDLLAYLARRRAPARLLLVGTYRPVEVIVHDHPLKAVVQDVVLRRQGVELRLAGLDAPAVAAYLERRFAGVALPADLAPVLHRRTDGHPLFLVTVADWWEQQGWVGAESGRWTGPEGGAALAGGVPESLRTLIETQFEGLNGAEQRLLEVASVAGEEFSTLVVAAGLAASVTEVEERCAALGRRGQFLQASGVDDWPDGTVAERYRFRHALYPQVLYDRLSVGRRLELHRQLGARLEAGYGVDATDHAAELAMHWDRGRDYARAVPYLTQAAANALRRWAYQEAIGHLTRGLEVLQLVPDTPARRHQELDLQVALGHVVMATKGQAAPDVERIYARAQELCQQIGDTPQRFPVLRGLMAHAMVRGQLQTAHQLGKQLLGLAQAQSDPAHRMIAHHQLGMVEFYRGELATAQTHHQQALALYTPQAHRALAVQHGLDFGVGAGSHLAWELWQLGYPDQALQHSQAAGALAQEVAHPHSLALALVLAAVLHQYRREVTATHEQAAAAMSLATEQGFVLWGARGMVLHGWALAMQGQSDAGLAEMRQGLAAALGTGARLWQPYMLGLLAEAYGAAGQPEAGLPLLDEAVAVMQTTGNRFYAAELYRLKAALLLRQAALDLARAQQAKSWELRVAVSLARLWRSQHKCQVAYELLAPVYGWFTEGCGTADVHDAKTLCDALRS
jgi:predicted ATPase/DNA-binding winged helix-turn-helix (wHTH) protein